MHPAFKIFLLLAAFRTANCTETPIIGVLSQEGKFDSYIAASYVKFVESAGGRALPIWIGQSAEYYQRVVNYTNGLLFPGGAVLFSNKNGYADAARTLYSLAVEANEKGVYYPVWGTCLGMEILAIIVAGTEIREKCSAHYVAMPLIFSPDYTRGRLYSAASQSVIDALKTENITYNAHGYCMSEAKLKGDYWRLLTTNYDDDGFEFVSSFESQLYPIYGVQFHPEKNSFEHKEGVNIPHTANAIRVCQFYADFFVNECRKNENRFPNGELEAVSLIFNFNATYSGLDGSYYTQVYGFTKDDFKKNQLM